LRYVEFVRNTQGYEEVWIKWLTIPGEFAPELITGVPSNFDTPEGTAQYYLYPQYHATQENYTFPGFLNTMLDCSQPCDLKSQNCTSCWFMGLTMDEVGYIFPMSDWRIPCLTNFFGDNCSTLPLDYFDSMSAFRCNQLAEDPNLAPELYGPNAEAILSICAYGQFGEAEDHYEETNSIGWNINQDYFNAVSKLLGVENSGRYTN